MSEKMRALTTRELEDLVRWFTYHMSGEMRRQLMGELPLHYKILYPEVDSEAITAQVISGIARVSAQADLLPYRAGRGRP